MTRNMLRKMFILWFVFMALPLVATARDLNIINYSTTVMPVWQFAVSSPRDNELLDGSPKALAISFSMNVDPNHSGFAVYDPYNNLLSGLNVTTKDVAMTADLPVLGNGTYRVEWHAACLCKDTTPLQGIFHFTVQ